MKSWLRGFAGALGGAAVSAAAHYIGITDVGKFLTGLESAVVSAVIGAVVAHVAHSVGSDSSK